jgi:hypothetical protein
MSMVSNLSLTGSVMCAGIEGECRLRAASLRSCDLGSCTMTTDACHAAGPASCGCGLLGATMPRPGAGSAPTVRVGRL